MVSYELARAGYHDHHIRFLDEITSVLGENPDLPGFILPHPASSPGFIRSGGAGPGSLRSEGR